MQPMGIKEILNKTGDLTWRAALLTATIGTASYCAQRSGPVNVAGIEQPLAPPANTPIPSSGRLESKPTLVPREPLQIYLLKHNYYLRTWRTSLPEDSEVVIIDFGRVRHSGLVLPEEGLRLRQLPNVDSKPAEDTQLLRAGQEINFRNLISIFNPKTGEEESWIVVDEKGQPGSRWHCGPGWPRGHALCFAAARIGDEEFIDPAATAPPRAESVTSHNWPR